MDFSSHFLPILWYSQGRDQPHVAIYQIWNYQRKTLYVWLPIGIYLSLKNGNLDIFSFLKFDEFGWNFPWLSFISGFFPQFFSGGRHEGSKRNLNFQSATWHHLKHFQRKAEGDQPAISVGAASWPGWTSTHVGSLTFLSEASWWPS
jgi:hypothetical protein